MQLLPAGVAVCSVWEQMGAPQDSPNHCTAQPLRGDSLLPGELRFFELGVALLYGYPVTMGERERARVFRDDVIREPSPLAIARPIDLVPKLLLGRLCAATRADDPHAPITTEATYFPEIAEIPI